MAGGEQLSRLFRWSTRRRPIARPTTEVDTPKPDWHRRGNDRYGALEGLAMWSALRFAAGVLSAWTLVATSAWVLKVLVAVDRTDGHLAALG